MSVIGKYPESKSSFGRVGQVLRNAVLGKVTTAHAGRFEIDTGRGLT